MRDITLDHRYAAMDGQVLVTGQQALVRLPLEQARLDKARGLSTAGYISGYRGSPLGSYDQELTGAANFLKTDHIVFLPAVNEELAADAIWGTQSVNLFPGAKYEGVFGLWYGKAPGLDRATDAMRHANYAGTWPKGGVVALCGDDPECKSSTLPTQNEYLLVHEEIPILNPASIQEVLDFGILGIAMSRYSGCWVGLICATDLMDGHGVIEVGAHRYTNIPERAADAPGPSPYIRFPDTPLGQEERLRKVKLPLVLEFAQRAGLNKRVIDSANRRIGLVSSGRAFGELMQALQDLGLTEDKCRELGISVFKLDMLWPMDTAAMNSFADGLQTILVVEDKRQLIESSIRDAIYDLPAGRRPRVLGKRDADGQLQLSEGGILGEHEIAAAVAKLLPPNALPVPPAAFKANADPAKAAPTEVRTPFFCSGCPHNRSTRVLPGERALAGIGCHFMAQWQDPATSCFSQMGGEGVAWVGQAPFTTQQHVFANIGDGTYFHSGILAIRQAVGAKARMTYKILFNDAVAMTGGQSVDGPLDPPRISRQVAAEGVARVAIVAEDPDKYDGATNLAPGTTVHPRDDLQQVEREFQKVDGVTVIIYDQMCAAEKRRRRKRKLLADPKERTFINELVCEGCGDCSVKSNCISVEPVETDFGRKRRINQSACNKDFTCTEGFCPSFVTISGGKLKYMDSSAVVAEAANLPAPPVAPLKDPYNILISGIGGLGVTTLSGILSMAAHLENHAVRTINRTGMAQKGGAVSSHVRVANKTDEMHSGVIPDHATDLHFAYDMIVATGPATLAKTASNRTKTLINRDLNPTGAFVRNTTAKHYDEEGLEHTLQVGSQASAGIDARQLAETFFGNELYASMIMLGYVIQKGWLPLRLSSVRQAITLNRASEALNRAALDLGRLAAAAPEKVTAAAGTPNKDLSPVPSDDLATMIEERRKYLTAYQSAAYARKFTALVARVKAAEEAKVPGTQALAKAVARGAFTAMAIKDEYEVARLLTGRAFRNQLKANFTGDYSVSYNFAPPLFAPKDKNTGLPRKMKFGPWLRPVLKLMAGMKILRETPLDVMGREALRQTERRLRDEYLARMDEVAARLTPANHALAVEIAGLPLEMRGYGYVKERAIGETEARLRELWARFTGQSTNPNLQAAE